MSQQSSSNTGIGFNGFLQLLFIGLKLTGYIDWPWVWVLAPTLIWLLIALVLIIAVAIYSWFKP